VLLLGAVVLVVLFMSVVFFSVFLFSVSGIMCRVSVCSFVSVIAFVIAIRETKVQADPLHIPPEIEEREDGKKTTTDITRITRTTAPRSSTHVTPIYTWIQ